MVSGLGCGLVTGLDDLNRVSCVDVCEGGASDGGRDETSAGEDAWTDAMAADSQQDAIGPDAAFDADVGPDAAFDTDAGPDAAPDAAGDGAISDASNDLADAPRDTGPSDGTSSDGAACLEDLSNIGTADFDVSLVVTTTQAGVVALVNQRRMCGGLGTWWDLRMTDGFVLVETGTANFTSAGARVNDGKTHRISLRRRAGQVKIYIDDVDSGSAFSNQFIGQLPPFQMRTDPCVGSPDMTMTFVGTITNVCVTSP
jgi:hypothetical protein